MVESGGSRTDCTLCTSKHNIHCLYIILYRGQLSVVSEGESSVGRNLTASGSLLLWKPDSPQFLFFLAPIELFELESFSRTKKYTLYSDQNMIRLGTFLFNYEQSII